MRKGYIEFEYENGDTIAELKQRVAEVWGTPDAKSRIFDNMGVWVLLCEDEAGAHLPLTSNDVIPIFPPSSTTEIYTPRIGPNPDEQLSLPGGVIYSKDVEEAVVSDKKYRDYYFDREMMLKRKHEQPKVHLQLRLEREYDILVNRSYSVKLLALAVITGG